MARPGEVDGRDSDSVVDEVVRVAESRRVLCSRAAGEDRVVGVSSSAAGKNLRLAGASGEAPLPGVTASLGGRTAARALAIAAASHSPGPGRDDAPALFSIRVHDEPLDGDADRIRADRLVEIEVVVETELLSKQAGITAHPTNPARIALARGVRVSKSHNLPVRRCGRGCTRRGRAGNRRTRERCHGHQQKTLHLAAALSSRRARNQATGLGIDYDPAKFERAVLRWFSRHLPGGATLAQGTVL